VLSTDANETCQMANQVWPIAAYPELYGSFTNFQGRVQRINAAFPPPGNAIAGVEAIARLGHALDGIDRPHSPDAVFAAMASEEPAFKGLRLANLGEHGADLAAS
jgi:predicted molibdopterin-dependent oxidoreductase YjgC